MKISVIVPVYNIESYVGKCIESIINQNYQNMEIILVDDGSTDSSGKICDIYAAKDNRIKVIHKINTGVVSARKVGCKIATGEYIVAIDGDDWIEETYIEKFVREIINTGEKVIWSVSYYKEYSFKTELCESTIFKDINSETPLFQNEAMKLVSGFYGFQNDIEYSIWTKCINRELYCYIQDMIKDNMTRGEDFFFSIILLNITKNIWFTQNMGYHYVQRLSSNTHNKQGYSFDRYKNLQDILSDYSIKLKKEKKSLDRIIKGYLLSTYMLYFFGTMKNEKIEYLYPFSKVKKNSKVIIYGAGSVGQNIVSFLNNSKNYEIVAWVDSKIKDKKIENHEIQLVNQILEINYDYIILATNRTIYSNQMREELKKLGVQDEKIVSVFDNI